MRDERAEIAMHWRQLSSTLGQHVTIEEGGVEYRGRVLDLSLEHGLIVRLDPGGAVRLFHPAHITRCREC